MKRITKPLIRTLAVLGCLIVLWLFVSSWQDLIGGPLNRMKAEKDGEVGPYSSKCYVIPFKGQEKATIIVIGTGTTPLGLFVYDKYGNCVARDDTGSDVTKDDQIVIWYPTRTDKFVVEVRNRGPLPNPFKITVR